MTLKLCSCLPEGKDINKLESNIKLNPLVLHCFSPEDRKDLENLVSQLNSGQKLSAEEEERFRQLIFQHNLFDVGLL